MSEANTSNCDVAPRLTANEKSLGRKRHVEAYALENSGILNVCYSQFEQIEDLQHDLEEDDARRKRKITTNQTTKKKKTRKRVKVSCQRSGSNEEDCRVHDDGSTALGEDNTNDKPSPNIRRRRRRKQVASGPNTHGAVSVPISHALQDDSRASPQGGVDGNRSRHISESRPRQAHIRREKQKRNSNQTDTEEDGYTSYRSSSSVSEANPSGRIGHSTSSLYDEGEDSSSTTSSGSASSRTTTSRSSSRGSTSTSSSSSSSSSSDMAREYNGNKDRKIQRSKEAKTRNNKSTSKDRDVNSRKHSEALSSDEPTPTFSKNKSGSLLGKGKPPCTAVLSNAVVVVANMSHEIGGYGGDLNNDDVSAASRSVHSTSVIDVDGIRKRSSNKMYPSKKNKRVERKISRNVERESILSSALPNTSFHGRNEHGADSSSVLLNSGETSSPIVSEAAARVARQRGLEVAGSVEPQLGGSITETLPYECSPVRDRASMERIKPNSQPHNKTLNNNNNNRKSEKCEDRFPFLASSHAKHVGTSKPSAAQSLKPFHIAALLSVVAGVEEESDEEDALDTQHEFESFLVLASQMRELLISSDRPTLPETIIDPELLKDVVPEDAYLYTKLSEGHSGVGVYRRDNRKRFTRSERHFKRQMNVLAGLGDSSNMADCNMPNGESLYSQSVSATSHDRHRPREEINSGVNASNLRSSKGASGVQFGGFISAKNQKDEIDWYTVSKDHGADGIPHRGSYGDAAVTPSLSRSGEVDRQWTPSRFHARASPQEAPMGFWRPPSGHTPPTMANRSPSVKSRSGALDASSGYSMDNPLRKNTWNVQEKYLSDMSGNADMPSMTTKGSTPYGDSVNNFARSRDRGRSYNAFQGGEDVAPTPHPVSSGVDRLQLLIENAEEREGMYEPSPIDERLGYIPPTPSIEQSGKLGFPISSSQSSRPSEMFNEGQHSSEAGEKEMEKGTMHIKGRPSRNSVGERVGKGSRGNSEHGRGLQSSEYPVEPSCVPGALSAELLVPPSKVSKGSRNSKSTTIRSRHGSDSGISDSSPTRIGSSAKKSIVSDWFQKQSTSTAALDVLTSSEEEDVQESKSSRKSKGIGANILASFRSSKSSGKQQNPKDSNVTQGNMSLSNASKQIPVTLFHNTKRVDGIRVRTVQSAAYPVGTTGTDDVLAVSCTSDYSSSNVASPTTLAKDVEGMGQTPTGPGELRKLPTRPQPALPAQRIGVMPLVAQYQTSIETLSYHKPSALTQVPTTPSKRREASRVSSEEVLSGESGTERSKEGKAHQTQGKKIHSCDDLFETDEPRDKSQSDDEDALRHAHSVGVTATETASTKRTDHQNAWMPSKGVGNTAERSIDRGWRGTQEPRTDLQDGMKKGSVEHNIALPSLIGMQHGRRASYQSPVVPHIPEGVHPIPTPPISPGGQPTDRSRKAGFDGNGTPSKITPYAQHPNTDVSAGRVRSLDMQVSGRGAAAADTGVGLALPVVISPTSNNSPWSGATSTETTPPILSEQPQSHVQSGLNSETNASRSRALSTIALPESQNRSGMSIAEERLQIPQAPETLPDQSRRFTASRVRQYSTAAAVSSGGGAPPQQDRQLSNQSHPHEGRLSSITIPFNRSPFPPEAPGTKSPRTSLPYPTSAFQLNDNLTAANVSVEPPRSSRRAPVPDIDVLNAIQKQSLEAMEGTRKDRPRGLSLTIATTTTGQNIPTPVKPRAATLLPRDAPFGGDSVSSPSTTLHKGGSLFLPNFRPFSPQNVPNQSSSFEDGEYTSFPGGEPSSMMFTSPATRTHNVSTPTSTLWQSTEEPVIGNRSLSTMPELGTGQLAELPVTPRSPFPLKYKPKQDTPWIANNKKNVHRAHNPRRQRASSIVFKLGDSSEMTEGQHHASDKDEGKSELQTKSTSSKDSSSQGKNSAEKRRK